MRLIVFILALFMFACNPVKKVLQDPQKFEQVAQEVVRRGYCINDTVTVETVKDSTIYKDSIITKTIEAPCADFDTTLKDGTHITVVDGILKVKSNCQQKENIRTIVKTNNIRDRKLEEILHGDIKKLEGENKALINQVNSLKSEVVSNNKKHRADKFKLWLIIAGLVAWTLRGLWFPLIKKIF
jgi:hypothetical protein